MNADSAAVVQTFSSGVPVAGAGRRTSPPGSSAAASDTGSAWSAWRCVTNATAVRPGLDGPGSPTQSRIDLVREVSCNRSITSVEPAHSISMPAHARRRILMVLYDRNPLSSSNGVPSQASREALARLPTSKRLPHALHKLLDYPGHRVMLHQFIPAPSHRTRFNEREPGGLPRTALVVLDDLLAPFRVHLQSPGHVGIIGFR